MDDSNEVRCPACNAWFTPRGRRKYCSEDCSARMATASVVCAGRLRSVNKSIDQTCSYCGDPLGPFDITRVTKNLPGRRTTHPECKRLRANEVVGSCECGRDLRRRDGEVCGSCRRAQLRDEVRDDWDVGCGAEYTNALGDVVKCPEVAYPLMEYCSKHRNDLRRFGQFRDWLWRKSDYEGLISQSEIQGWRDRLLDQQGGRCGMFELCGKDESNNDTWHLDHDHSCDRHSPKRMCPKCVRGVLCWFCNVAVLGALEKDDMSPLDAARAIMHYLESGDQLSLAV